MGWSQDSLVNSSRACQHKLQSSGPYGGVPDCITLCQRCCCHGSSLQGDTRKLLSESILGSWDGDRLAEEPVSFFLCTFKQLRSLHWAWRNCGLLLGSWEGWCRGDRLFWLLQKLVITSPWESTAWGLGISSLLMFLSHPDPLSGDYHIQTLKICDEVSSLTNTACLW